MDDLLKAMMQFSKETGLLIGFSFEIMSPDNSADKMKLAVDSFLNLSKTLLEKEKEKTNTQE